MNAISLPIAVSDEVREALSRGQAVVALESTIITHGMPFPSNLDMAREVEGDVRAAGAVPATIAVAGGRLVVGMEAEQLRLLAQAPAAKASTRDLAPLLTRGATAGTTVAATMRIAAMAGIAVFATGGIGGVHRGASESFDVSGDLTELGRSPVAVVCAGAKSILDIPKTLEYLETHQVPVLGFRCSEFPAFFARSSGMPIGHRVESAEEAARTILAHRRLAAGGVLIANPIPESDAIDASLIEAKIAAACREADEAGIGHQELTPFLLARVVEATGGASLRANIALVRNNARVAAAIAVALSGLARE